MNQTLKKGEKRKASASPDKGNDSVQKVCILHYNESANDDFTFLMNNEDPKKRFEKIIEIKTKRLAQNKIAQRMESTCNLIPDELTNIHGYHRSCYQRFLRNSSRLKMSLMNEEKDGENERPHRRLCEEKDKVIFKPDCIFCRKDGKKRVKKNGFWVWERTTIFEDGGDKKVQEDAEKSCDEELLIRIRGFDLFSVEARFHPTCRRQYIRLAESRRSTNEQNVQKQQKMEDIHQKCFNKICKKVNEVVIEGKNVMKLSDLRQIYVTELDQTEFANPKYRGEKLKNKLISKYGEELSFIPIDSESATSSYIIHRSDIDKADAVRNAYLLGSKDKLEEAGSCLRDIIIQAFKKTEPSCPWPPTQEFLEGSEKIVPETLYNFLKSLISGKSKNKISTEKVHRLILSIGQDICRAVTNGRWKMPKHILICMTLRHLFRSAELITLMNRLGHSENYSFSLELDTAIANALQKSTSLLSACIARNLGPDDIVVFHSDFDNFDQLLNELTGMGSIHTANGIMCCEGATSRGEANRITSLPKVTRTKERTFKFQELPKDTREIFMSKRKSPPYNFSEWRESIPEWESAYKKARKVCLIWFLLRLISAEYGQEIPGWGGFISYTGSKPDALTQIDYYPVINSPITEYSTIQQCLHYSEQASTEAGQEYHITSFDLGAAMKAYPILFNYAKRYEKHIVTIGSFHLTMAYFRVVGKKMNGSGLWDVFTEAGLISSGSLQGVISGKNYARSMYIHKVATEALERLLFEKFLQSQGSESISDIITDQAAEKLIDFINSPNPEHLSQLVEDEDISKVLQDYILFCDKVENGSLGKTAKYFKSYSRHINLVMQLMQAVKTNDYLLYCQCCYLMADLFFAFDGHNYSRYLTFYSVFLANIDNSHPGASHLLKNGAISVARSFIPGNRCAVDKTIEETMMKHSKSRGGVGGSGIGLSGLLNKPEAYQRWVKTAHERAKYVAATFNMANMLSDGNDGIKHRELRPTEISRHEKHVLKTMEAFRGFMNPFNTEDKGRLYCLSSGSAAPTEIENDILNAEKIGRDCKEDFIKNRLEVGKDFFEKITRNSLKTFAHMDKKVKVTTSQKKVIEYKEQGNVAMFLLFKSQQVGNPIQFEVLMSFCITPVPYSIATTDGQLAKTNKAKGMNHMLKEEEDAELPPAEETLIVQDGNAVYHQLTDVPPDFTQIAKKIFDMVPVCSDFVFSTDNYPQLSIKQQERDRRGSGERLRITKKTKKPRDWKSFLTNNDNKVQLSSILCEVWSDDDMASRIKDREIIVTNNEKAYSIQSKDGKTESQEMASLSSTQEETDTRVILYCNYAQERGYKYVRVRSPDSDIFFILLHHASNLNIVILYETGTGNKRRLINVTLLAEEYTQVLSSALLSLHYFTGADTTSAFKGKGKIKAIKILLSAPKYQKIFAQIGCDWHLSDEVKAGLESFVCILYGQRRCSVVNEARYLMLQKKCKGDLSAISKKNINLASFPPCQSALNQHFNRVNLAVGVCKLAMVRQPEYPLLTDGQGWIMQNGRLEPLWTEESVLPAELADILEQRQESDKQKQVSDDQNATDDEDSEIDQEFDSDSEDSDDD